MVIHSVTKHHANDLHGGQGAASKARRANTDKANQSSLDADNAGASSVQSSQSEISNEADANSAVQWLRNQIATNFRAVVAIQGNLDPLRVAQLVEA